MTVLYSRFVPPRWPERVPERAVGVLSAGMPPSRCVARREGQFPGNNGHRSGARPPRTRPATRPTRIWRRIRTATAHCRAPRLRARHVRASGRGATCRQAREAVPRAGRDDLAEVEGSLRRLRCRAQTSSMLSARPTAATAASPATAAFLAARKHSSIAHLAPATLTTGRPLSRRGATSTGGTRSPLLIDRRISR